jgi:hypothetical protein
VRVAERVRGREIDDDEGRRLLRIIRRGTGSVVTRRRAQMVLLSTQGMPVAKTAEMTFTGDDRVRDVIHKGSMIRHCIIRRNRHAADLRLRDVVDRANVARCGTRAG